jgi:hypothetical protein
MSQVCVLVFHTVSDEQQLAPIQVPTLIEPHGSELSPFFITGTGADVLLNAHKYSW